MEINTRAAAGEDGGAATNPRPNGASEKVTTIVMVVAAVDAAGLPAVAGGAVAEACADTARVGAAAGTILGRELEPKEKEGTALPQPNVTAEAETGNGAGTGATAAADPNVVPI